MIATQEYPNIDELYRDLVTARGEANQALQWRTRFLSAEKDKAKLRAELLDAYRQLNAANAQLAQKETPPSCQA